MENIKNTILFANIKGENGREVREARIVELNERPCHFYFNKSTKKLEYVRGCGIGFMLEIAGIGEVSSYKLLNEYKGGLYKTLNIALQNNENYSLFRKGYNENILNIGCIADIDYDDLNLTHPCTTLDFEYVRVNSYINATHFRLKPISYYWDGTKTKQYEINWKFQFDLVENKVQMYKGGCCDYEDKLGKLYATREMCEKTNKPTIVRFDKQKEKEFNFTFRATVRIEGDSFEDCVRKFESADIFGKNVQFDEIVYVEDVETGEDLTNEYFEI